MFKKIISMMIYIAISSIAIYSFSFSDLDAKAREEVREALVLKVGSSKVYNKLNIVNIDKKNPDVKPYVKKGRTMVPIRFIAEAFRQHVTWDPKNNWIHVANFGYTRGMIFKLNKNEALVDNKSIPIDVPAEIFEGRAFLPIRTVVENLWMHVFYKDDVIIIRHNPINSKNDWIETIVNSAKKIL